MPFRFVTKSIHTYLIDYPVATVLMIAPFLLKPGKSSPVALWLSVATRVTALLLPALTDHPTGLVRVIHDWLHLSVDRALGVVSITAPSAFHFTGLDAWYHWVLAAAVLLTTSVLNAPEVNAAQRANLDTFGPKSKVEEGAVVKLGGRFFVIAVSTGNFMCDGNEIMGISTQPPQAWPVVLLARGRFPAEEMVASPWELASCRKLSILILNLPSRSSKRPIGGHKSRQHRSNE